MGFAVATCLGFAALLSITFPFLIDRLHTIGAFGLYAGFNVVAFVMIFFLVPETKQRTLEELDYIFAVSTQPPYRNFSMIAVPGPAANVFSFARSPTESSPATRSGRPLLGGSSVTSSSSATPFSSPFTRATTMDTPFLSTATAPTAPMSRRPRRCRRVYHTRTYNGLGMHGRLFLPSCLDWFSGNVHSLVDTMVRDDGMRCTCIG